MSEEKFKYQYAGVKWLYEMELLDDPQLVNNLKLNIFSTSKHVKESEFIMSQEDKKMLIYIELSWWGRTFKAREIKQDIVELLSQLLPNYRFRVTTDRSIIDLALQKLKKSLNGGTYAVSTTDRRVAIDSSDSTGQEDRLQESSNLLSNKDEQSEDKQQEGNEVVEPNLQSGKEAQNSD